MKATLFVVSQRFIFSQPNDGLLHFHWDLLGLHTGNTIPDINSWTSICFICLEVMRECTTPDHWKTLKDYALITSLLFHFKSIVVVYRGWIMKTLPAQHSCLFTLSDMHNYLTNETRTHCVHVSSLTTCVCCCQTEEVLIFSSVCVCVCVFAACVRYESS